MMENVRIAILSADDTVCAFLDNDVDRALHYYDETLHTYLQGSQYTFEATVLADHEDAQNIIEGNHCSFKYKNHDYYCTIIKVEKSEEEIIFLAYGLTLELTNETVDAFSGTSLSFEQYIQHYGFENTFVIGVNEVSDKRISYEWTGQDTILSRLFSTATAFDAELEFVTELNDDYSLKQITMNVYRKHDEENQGIGEDKSGTVIRYGQEIRGISKTSDISDLYTAIRPIGTDGLTVASIGEREVLDENGNREFYHANGGTDIYAWQSRDRFPSLAMGADYDRWIVSYWSYETDNPETLYGQALAQLKKNCVPKVEYDVDSYIDGNIGDTYTIEDAEFNPVLYLEARIVEQEICFTDKTKCKTKLDNFTELTSEISEDLLSQMEDMINANKTYQLIISSSNGLVLPEGVDTTVLSARVKDGSEDITSRMVVKWYKGIDLVFTGTSLSVSRDELAPSVVYQIEAEDSTGKVRATTEVTIAKVDGSGVTVDNVEVMYQVSDSGTATPTGTWVADMPEVPQGKYLWVRTITTYSDGISVTQYSVTRNPYDGEDGDSVSIVSTSVMYQAGTSGTVPPTGEWSENVPSVGSGQFLWTRTTVTYSDGQQTVSYSVSRNGSDGQDGTSVTITSTSVEYAVSDSGTTAPSRGWSETIPATDPGDYLWCRTIVNYSDGKSTTSYSVSRIGVDGIDGSAGYSLTIESSNGQLFRGQAINTTLTAHIYHGSDELSGSDLTNAGTITWYADGSSTPGHTGQILTIDEGDVESSITYLVKLIKDEQTLALNSISLAQVTDIQGIYRFYQLATSKPSTPTVYPPSEPWVSTEPEFDMTNQGSLYYIDCTLFNDLTFQYGEVQISSDYEAVKKTYADALQQIENSKQEINSDIQKNNDMIRTEVSETYYSKDEMNTQLGQVSTALEQTKNSFEMQFNSFQADLESLNDDNTAKFQQIFKYIRFEDGNIILGESGNELTLTIENDQIAFKQNGQVVAYFTNNKLYVTDGEFVHTLRIGSFIYSPRPDGSLDFKKG